MTLILPKGLTLTRPAGSWEITPTFTWNESVWNPSMLDTALWFDAADSSTITESEGAVSQWNDKSRNAFHISQATAGSRPAYTVNALAGKPVLTFDGSDDVIFRTTGLSGISNVTIISVFRIVAAVADDVPMALGPSGINGALRGFYRAPNSSAVTAAGWARDFTSTLNYDVGGSHHIFGAMNTSLTTPNNWQAHRDGVVQTGSSANGNLVATGAGFGVGTVRTLASFYTNMEVAEIVVLAFDVATGTRQRIEGYLAHKWGLTANLPSDHPYKTVGPTP